MEIMDAIYSRRAVRDYTDQPVDGTTINLLLNASVQAPSSINEQPWAFTVIQDRALLKRYSEQAKALMLQRPEIANLGPQFRELLSAPNFDTFHNATTLIVIWAKPGGLSGEHATWDCCFAAQNLMLAAHSMGLGTCPIGFAWSVMETPVVKQELNVPADYVPVLPIVVGYPKETTPSVARKQPEILCWR